MIYSFWLFDRHSECIYRREWNQPTDSTQGSGAQSSATTSAPAVNAPSAPAPRSASQNDDVAKLIFGIVFSLRNVSRKLLGDDSFTNFSTNKYRLHYYESPSNLKLVMLTDPLMESLGSTLYEIYATLYLEYVVKNPLSPVEHAGGVGVDNELFTMSLDAFVQSQSGFV